ncbi:unnamed protein product [Clonostachys rhizophaga]|uniref:non-specific serine/threonine protein kinase n=1 Tax=Clonostachys rhizophaga TaxID=160324 RepID=A0A9N9VV89_9HYPO|nr:unnamed protein product [Clonostachys rhizophaga]
MESSQQPQRPHHRRRPSSPAPIAHTHHRANHHHHLHRPSQPQLFTHFPPAATLQLRTSHNTPASSPGLFSPSTHRNPLLPPPTSLSESTSPAPGNHPYLHPLQTYKVRETHKALIDSDNITGRKLINQYEVIEEIGRGMHGKVKLARNLETHDNVAIKIIPRFSKKRRLGKVTAKSPQDKTKREIAILKKIRHPNVVALLEVIDDPELKKIYMVLEHAELGEVIWRKKGLPHIYQYERRRIEREMAGEPRTEEEEQYDQILEQRQALKEHKRARMAQNYNAPSDYWSVEYGAANEPSSYGQQSRVTSRDDFANGDGSVSRTSSRPPSRGHSQGPSRSHSAASMGMSMAFSDLEEEVNWDDELETPGPVRSNPNSSIALDGAMFSQYSEDRLYRGRRPSVADSIISHMSSVDYYVQNHDAFTDDFSYVPCFTMDQARATFRDTVLGLEYLHYQGVVHRDIKPANLLWSKDHRVKISDFGVSYFGRPIRDGEPDDTVSESEAKDFDDDLELAKTVGTPAFFAPEICYTDISKEQPKVSEQIDVWSLGVTLYCLIFARIPFLAEDEFQMFKKIATEDVYIPRRRLLPVDPSTSPMTTSLYNRHSTYPYRNDNDLAYEEIDPLLLDLLRQMLIKNPEQRIRLRDIKRHPWVLQGLSNPVGWLDDTDPGRPSSGRKIQVNERDVSDAVVPLTFLERARSAVKKAVGKVIHPLVERSDSRTRHRATSSVASSSGDTSMFNGPPTSHPGEGLGRRQSLKPDDYFALAIKDNLAAREKSFLSGSEIYDPMATVLPQEEQNKPESAEQSDSSTKPVQLHSRTPSRAGLHIRTRASRVFESLTTPTLGSDGARDNEFRDETRKTRASTLPGDDASRAQSVDRGLFGSMDKHAAARVAVSPTTAGGDIQRPATPCHPRAMRSVDLGRAKKRQSYASPLGSSIQNAVIAAIENGQPPRELAAPRPGSRRHTPSNSESNIRAGYPTSRYMDGQLWGLRATKSDPAAIPCPPSDEEDGPARSAPIRGNTMTTVKSSSTDSLDGLETPLTCPSEVTSPTSTQPPTKNGSEQTLAFQSDPSLPALLSGASSVSADMEAELLNGPGVVSTKPSLLETTDSLTPPAHTKEPAGGFPLDQVFGYPSAMGSGSLTLRVDHAPDTHQSLSDDDDDSDDGFLVMAKSKRKSTPVASLSRRAPFEAKRRDTNISTTSTETAKPGQTEHTHTHTHQYSASMDGPYS